MKCTFKHVVIANTLAIVVLSSPLLQASEDETPSGQELYKTACMACHVVEGKPTIAPPIFAVKNHVLDVYPERDEFIERIKSWVKAPSKDEALMRGAIRKFGLMPAMAHISDEDLQAIAEYIYDTDMELPEWYEKHYEEEHGKKPKSNKPATDG